MKISEPVTYKAYLSGNKAPLRVLPEIAKEAALFLDYKYPKAGEWERRILLDYWKWLGWTGTNASKT